MRLLHREGVGLHDELALLVRAGLSPMEAIEAATRKPFDRDPLQRMLTEVEQAAARWSGTVTRPGSPR